MSTRIGNAFAVPTVDAARLADLVASFRARLAPRRAREHRQLVARMASLSIDRAVALDREWPADALGTAYGQVDDSGREIDQSRIRHPLFDFGMELSLIPDAETSTTYGIAHCERRQWVKAWMRHAGAAPFSYGDGGDRPSHIPAREWTRRRDVWERVMPTGIPARHGFSASVFETRVHDGFRNPMALDLPLDARRMRIAEEIVMAELVPSDGSPISVTVSRIGKARDWMSSPEGRARMASEAAQARIPLRITEALARSMTRPHDLQLAPAA